MLMRTVALGAGLLLWTGCPSKCKKDPPSEPPAASPEPEVEAGPTLEAEPNPEAGSNTTTSAECEANGGRIVGDIGDGAIHRPDYKCEGGQPPIARIVPAEGEPIASEGSVCCPAP